MDKTKGPPGGRSNLSGRCMNGCCNEQGVPLTFCGTLEEVSGNGSGSGGRNSDNDDEEEKCGSKAE